MSAHEPWGRRKGRARRRYRVERDALGAKRVPADAYYGIFTLRARENFPVSGLGPPREVLAAYIQIKLAAARANRRLGLLAGRLASAIIRAAREALAGKFAEHFILDAFTAGAGTPFNMNVNEVLANRANELLGGKKGDYAPVHPNDHVNLAQSSNDVTPTAVRLACLQLTGPLQAAIAGLAAALARKGRSFARVLKSARTHLQDAVPITLGQEFAAYAESAAKSGQRLEEATRRLRLLGIGATAAGTGINSHPRYARLVVRELQSLTRLRLGSAKNLVEATHSMADFMELANAVEEYAMELNRVANDLRILASGPFTGLDEIRLPEVEPGSSIMPGKVNPSVPEMVNMVAFQVFGSVLAVRHAALGGQLDLNIFTPTIALSLPGALQLLTRATAIFTRRCVTGIRANVAACREYLDRSAGLATALTPVLGYDRAAELVKRAVAAGTSVREVLLRDSGLSAAELARRLEPGSLTRPNLRTWRPF